MAAACSAKQGPKTISGIQKNECDFYLARFAVGEGRRNYPVPVLTLIKRYTKRETQHENFLENLFCYTKENVFPFSLVTL
jgi:hypothetical protein